MDNDGIRALLLDVPVVAGWSQLTEIIEQVLCHPNDAWIWPVLACQAVGGTERDALPGAAAALCLMLSITLVDDMLDEDPRGAHHRLGSARTSNLSLALQAVGSTLIQRAEMESSQRAAIMGSLAELALTTAFGQELSTRTTGTEDDYWRMMQAKSTPYYGAVLQIGAILGKAPAAVSDPLRRFGQMSGEIIQLYDDLRDAFQTPASPDWKRPHQNLLLLYAMSADHAERELFVAALPNSADANVLHGAQQILIRCGAISYCVYHIVKRFQMALDLLTAASLAERSGLYDMLCRQLGPLQSWLERLGYPLSYPSSLPPWTDNV